MKVMTAMYTLKEGGSYERFKMMIKTFIERHWEVHCLSLTPIPIKHNYFHNHVIHFPFRDKTSRVAKFIVFMTFPIWSIWIAWIYKIELIIAFGFLYAFIQGFSKWLFRKPLVTFIRGDSYQSLKIEGSPKYILLLNKIIEHFGLLLSDRIITNNRSLQKEILEKVNKRKNIEVEVLFNHIPSINISKSGKLSRMKARFGIPEGARVLITVGKISRGKNIKILIKCLQKIGIEDFYLVVAGDGTSASDFRYMEELKELAKSLNAEKKVIFTGWLKKEDLWMALCSADLFVLPSRHEGMPNSMLEALGLDLLCMGSDVPGIKDILQHEELVFDPVDEEALAKKLNLFFSDNQFSSKVRRLCQERKRIFTFNWEERLFQMVTRGFHSEKI